MKTLVGANLVAFNLLIPVVLLLGLGGVWYFIWAGFYDPVRDDGFTPSESIVMARVHFAIAIACLLWIAGTIYFGRSYLGAGRVERTEG
jgi:hypothetical protein